MYIFGYKYKNTIETIINKLLKVYVIKNQIRLSLFPCVYQMIYTITENFMFLLQPGRVNRVVTDYAETAIKEFIMVYWKYNIEYHTCQ